MSYKKQGAFISVRTGIKPSSENIDWWKDNKYTHTYKFLINTKGKRNVHVGVNKKLLNFDRANNIDGHKIKGF